MNKKSCLPKHYWRPIAVMGVVDDLEPYTLPSKKFRNNLVNFFCRNWIWKQKIWKVQCQISNRVLIYQKPFRLRNCSSQFDAEVAESFLHGLYYVCSGVSTSAILLQVSLEDTWPQKGEASFKALHTGLNILFLEL